jgi:DNA invertase Pin-like site-specific DNA recombinase
MRAGLYERVSTGIRDVSLSRSIEQQNEAGAGAVTRYGWVVADRYPEPGLSASRYARKSRPEWERLRADVRGGRLDIVVLWEPSRGSRELETWAGFLNDCRAHNVRIYIASHDQLYDLANGRDWRALAEDGVDSAYESEKTSGRVRRGVAAAALRGEPYGRIPYGYKRRYEHDPTHPKMRRPIQEPDETEAPTAREIITRLSRADSVSGIIYDLAQRGITRRDGEPWAHSSIIRMVLEGVVYIGKRRHNSGELLAGNWPPLVDEDVYWAAVAVLRDPARKAAATARGGIRPGAARWLLSYIATCARCGAQLTVTTNRRRNGVPEPQYRCGGKNSHCYAPVEWVDWLIGEAVVRWCAQPHAYAEITKGSDRDAVAAADEATAERQRLATFTAQAIAGTLTATAYARIATGIEARIAELEARAAQRGAPAELRALAGERGAREADIAARWLAMPTAARRSVIRKIAAPTLAPTGRGGALLSPHRVKPNFAVPLAAADFLLQPLLPLPAILAA